jgi:DNA repair protein RecN (Recombination protein N)
VLLELHVSELGIVADLTLLPGARLNAITGETGAGKTLLIEALELLLGGRADPGLVRDGAAEARIEGRFVDPATGDERILARVVPVEGRSRAYVDGRLATVGELGEIGARLVDLHGQHSHQSLLTPAVQRAALDHFAGEPALDALARYRTARAKALAVRSELDALGGDDRARARELDLLRFQVEEIDRAGVDDPGEDVTLEAEEALLADAVAHRDGLARAYEGVEGAALDAVGAAAAALPAQGPFTELGARLRSVQAELAELAHDLRLAQESILDDPERLEHVRARRQLLRELTRKYGETLTDVRRFAQEASRRQAELEGYETRATALQQQLDDLGALEQAAGRDLSIARRDASDRLGETVTAHLRELAMPAARCEVVVEAGEPTDDGVDRVTFLLAANPGEPARPMARAASGGELSRAMLAVRVVLSEAPPTLIFDEIDAGIGGEAGIAVGRQLADLARRHQVLCVTHLAQVAAFADTQVTVEKQERENRTVAVAASVEGAERVAELSRMLAGVGESTHARSHAAELLATAAEYRAEVAAGG